MVSFWFPETVTHRSFLLPVPALGNPFWSLEIVHWLRMVIRVTSPYCHSVSSMLCSGSRAVRQQLHDISRTWYLSNPAAALWTSDSGERKPTLCFMYRPPDTQKNYRCSCWARNVHSRRISQELHGQCLTVHVGWLFVLILVITALIYLVAFHWVT